MNMYIRIYAPVTDRIPGLSDRTITAGSASCCPVGSGVSEAMSTGYDEEIQQLGMCIKGQPTPSSQSASFISGLDPWQTLTHILEGTKATLENPILGRALRMCFFSRLCVRFFSLGPAPRGGPCGHMQRQPPWSLCHSGVRGSRCPAFSSKYRSTKSVVTNYSVSISR